MSDTAKPCATRDTFGETLRRLGEEDARIVVLDADLSESTRSSKFAEAFPERFFEMGIQEANMIGAATGLALSGKVAFCCSFSCFVTSRFDQIKVSLAYNDANVTIVGTHAGCGVGPDGYTQMALEDVALLRSLPNMTVLQPADDIETAQMVEHLVRHHGGPAFLRLTRQKLPRIHDSSYRMEMGKADVLREGSDLVICASGGCVANALEAASRLGDDNIAAGVINVHTLAPLDGETIAQTASASRKVMTVEDHGIVGGLGSAVCEALSERDPMRVWRVGLREFGESGAVDALYRKHSLDSAGIYEQAKRFLAA